VGFGLLGIISAAVLATVTLLGEHDGQNGNEWRTYQNSEHGYQIRYPPDWDFAEGQTHCDSDNFCTQGIEIEGPDGEYVVLIVNYQGGICESSPQASKDIVVSGHIGKEVRCGDSIFRYFEGVHGRINHWLRGTPMTDADVEKVIGTLQFPE